MKAIRLCFVVFVAVLALIGCANPQVTTPSAPTGSIEGQALFVDKADNSGIVISAEPTDGIRSLSVQRALSGRSLGEKAIAASTTTSASGSYTLGNLSPGTYVVTASSKDSLEKAVSASVTVAAAKATQVVTLSLTLPGQISGKAILSDAATQPNGSLGIVVFVAGTSFSAMTAKDGSYLISGVPPGKNYTLVASKVGYDSAITTANVVVLQTTAMATLTLSKSAIPAVTGSLSGTALLSDGPPHSGIFVYLAQTSSIAVTGASGAFSLTGIAPGTYSLAGSKDGYVPAAASVTVVAGGTADVGVLSLSAIPKEVSAPLFIPSTGSFSTDQLVTIGDATPGATIYYSIATGGAVPPDPTAASTAYTGPIPVAGNGTVATIKAIAAKAGMTTSAIAQSTISIVYNGATAATPTFSLASGNFDTAFVIISCTTPGASIYWSGAGPATTASTKYTGPIEVGGATTTSIFAIAVAPGYLPSSVASAGYKPYHGYTAPLIFSPAGGVYATAQSVTLSCATAEASIFYTLDGTEPTTASTKYTGPVTVTASPATTIKAIAVASYLSYILVPFSVATATYANPSIALVSIPAGSFNNGTSIVTLSAFRMAKYDITQSLYQSVTGTNPSYFASNGDAATCPVERVSWHDAVEFCNRLSAKDGLSPVYTISGRTPSLGYPITFSNVSADFTKNGYRLPTEAQWEYAARAGTTTTFYWGNASDDATVGQYAWFAVNSGSTTHAVGQKLPNGFGLFDMAGNVYQWCWDWYENYPDGAQVDPTGASSSSTRVIRGGGWSSPSYYLASGNRNSNSPYYSNNYIGFRVCAP